MSLIRDALNVAKKYYDEPTYYHAMRVAAIVADDNLIPNGKKDDCIVLAIMHDLLEDTKFTLGAFPMSYYLKDCLKVLTRNKETTYEDYIQKIKVEYEYHPEAYWVKLADIKDHLTQKETLTDKLKEKYLAAIPYLL